MSREPGTCETRRRVCVSAAALHTRGTGGNSRFVFFSPVFFCFCFRLNFFSVPVFVSPLPCLPRSVSRFAFFVFLTLISFFFSFAPPLVSCRVFFPVSLSRPLMFCPCFFLFFCLSLACFRFPCHRWCFSQVPLVFPLLVFPSSASVLYVGGSSSLRSRPCGRRAPCSPRPCHTLPAPSVPPKTRVT